jgi:hypothetical protein
MNIAPLDSLILGNYFQRKTIQTTKTIDYIPTSKLKEQKPVQGLRPLP